MPRGMFSTEDVGRGCLFLSQPNESLSLAPKLGGVLRRQIARVEQEPELVEDTFPSENILQVGGQSHGVG